MKKLKQKTIVLLMVLCMMATYMPAFAYATDAAQTEEQTPQATEEVQADPEEETDEAEPAATEPDQTEQVEQNETEEAPALKEEPATVETPSRTSAEDVSFTTDQADYLSYDPLYIGQYANPSYIDITSVDMNRFIYPVTAAKGIAAYTIDKDKSLDANSFIAGMTYEMPVYNLDDNAKYYVAVPNVNKFNGKNFKAFGLTVGYNNDEAENISGWKYEKGILYIPKTAIDNPENKHDVPENAKIAVQLNYAIGSDTDYSKTVPVQVLNGNTPKMKKVHTDNIFDVDSLTVNTGVKGRNAKDITVFLNGQLIPINNEAWEYDKSSGKIFIKAMPGVVSNINVAFEKQTKSEKAKSIAISALGFLADEVYAVTQDGMTAFVNESGQEAKLTFDVSQMFVGWRGHYTSAIKYKPNGAASYFESLNGYSNSVKYLYGGYTTHSGSDFEGATAAQKDQWLAPLWAIQSYAVAADTRNSGGDQGTLTWNEQVTHYYLNDTATGTMTIYEWLNTYRNSLEKSRNVHGGNEGNGIGGSNNFAFHFPANSTIAGSSIPMAHPEGSPKGNPSIAFKSTEISGSEWFAAGCSELGDAAESDADGEVYVTCLGLTEEYVVLAFAQVRSGQNMTGIYKFKVNVGYIQLTKTQAPTETDFLNEAPNNYSLAGAVYYVYTDAACTQRANDISGNPIVLTTGANGKTNIVGVEAGKPYWAKEINASKGYLLDTSVNSGEPVVPTTANTRSNPAPISSVEEPTMGVPISLRKVNRKGDYGWRRLLGAEYTLKYYDVSPSMTDIRGETPKRSWVFKTIEKTDPRTGDSYAGIDFATDQKISGDNFYTVKGTVKGDPDIHADYKHIDLKNNAESIRIMPCGVYTIEETKAPTGLTRNTTVYYGTIKQPQNGVVAKTDANTNMDNTMTIEIGTENDVVNDEDLQAVKIVINKYDKETDLPQAQGTNRQNVKGSLAGAKYEVYYDDNDLGTAELVGIITTDANGVGELSKRELGDERFLNQELKVGNYLVKEILAPPGYVIDKYMLNDGVTEEIPDGEIEVICGYEEDGTPKTKTIKGTFEDGKHLFRVRAETIDTHLFTCTITSKENPHHTYISKTDITTGEELPGALLQVIDSEGNVVEEWTSTDEPHDIACLHDETQGLKDGKYTLREITAPYGYDVAEDVDFEVKSDEIVNKVEMKNKPIIISTSATDTETDTHQGMFSEEAQVKDVVKIKGLYEGRTYQVKGHLMDKATGEPMKDSEGHDIMCTLVSVKNGTTKNDGENEFVAAGDDEEVTLMFNVDSSKYDINTTTVAFEKLYRTSKVHDVEADVVPRELQKHEDIDDEDQTIHYGGIIRTVALDYLSKSHNIAAKNPSCIIDKVYYENLSTKETYVVEGELYDKTTGQLTGIKSRMGFIPESSNGYVELSFNFDGSAYINHVLVCYEELYIKDKRINDHKDPSDPDQTVYVTDIRTKIGKKKGKYIVDTVTYNNLIPGKTYVMRGWFVKKFSGLKVKGSDGSTTFTPTSPNGSVEVKLKNVKGSGNIVAFEECYIINDDGKEGLVGEHKDLKDKDQLYKKGGKIVVSDKDKFRKGVKTGDDTRIVGWLALFTAALLSLLVYGIRRRGYRE